MTALGRHRALGAIGNTYYSVTLMGGMDPKEWAYSDPALKLNMTLVEYGENDTHLFACAADPATVNQLLMQDPRCLSATLLGGESVDVIGVEQAPGYVEEPRPAPGTPQVAYAGYVPKLPNDPTKSLSVVDQAMAALPAGAQAPAAQAVEAMGKVPWWAWAIGAALLWKRMK